MKNIFLISILSICTTGLFSQNSSNQTINPYPKNGLFQFYVNIKQAVPINYNKNDFLSYLNVSNYSQLNKLNSSIVSVQKSFQGQKLTSLLNRSVTVFSNNSRLDTLLSNLTSKLNFVENINFPSNPFNYEPNDLSLVYEGNAHLTYVNALSGWDMHRADSRIKIGFTDTYLDTLHEDIKGNVSKVFSNTVSMPLFHGTAVGGLLSAITNNGKGIASVAGNAKLVFSSDWGSDAEVLNIAREPKVRVINLSWFNSCSYSLTQNDLYQTIYDSLNVLVVSAAGNGVDHCGSKRAPVYPAAYPSIICVTSVNHLRDQGTVCPWYTPPAPCLIKDLHEVTPGDTNSNHHHYPEVDISAPGYGVQTLKYDTTGLHNLYGGAFGTSFASPIVASTCALVASFNPCLTAQQIRNVIIQSANPIIYSRPDNIKYAGLLGSGKLDVLNALKRAETISTRFEQNKNYTGTQNISAFKISAGYNVTSGTFGNVSVLNNSNVKYNVNYSAEFSGGFEVKAGGQFEVIVSESPCY